MTQIFEVAWPVDPDARLLEVRDVARREVAWLARQAGARLVGPVSWSVRGEGDDVLELVATALAVRAGRHVEHLRLANRAAQLHRGLVEAPTCTRPGCWHVCGPSGLCDECKPAARRERQQVPA